MQETRNQSTVMEIYVWVMFLALFTKPNFCQVNEEVTNNSTDPNKDMYVIHAMVYQVGIVSNKTDDDILNGTTANQEAITLYHTNGSNIDLSAIPSPLLTNITAQSVIGVAPKPEDNSAHRQLTWSALEGLTNEKTVTGMDQSTAAENNEAHKATEHQSLSTPEKEKRSWQDTFKTLFKRDVSAKDTVKILKGTAEIPKDAGVQSIALPPLLTLNNNFSDIPVPIPNTSVVHYAKLNTLVRSP